MSCFSIMASKRGRSAKVDVESVVDTLVSNANLSNHEADNGWVNYAKAIVSKIGPTQRAPAEYVTLVQAKVVAGLTRRSAAMEAMWRHAEYRRP